MGVVWSLCIFDYLDTLTNAPFLSLWIGFGDVSRLALAQVEIMITFGILISTLALDIQLAKLVEFGYCFGEKKCIIV